MSGPVLYVRAHERHVRIHLPAADVPTLRLGLLHVCEEDDLMQPSRSLKQVGTDQCMTDSWLDIFTISVEQSQWK
jgi:hypothetical protein